jgi:hypothetical protein
MKKQTKKKVLTPRLPKEEYLFLRSHGGAIRPKKGGDYDRAKEKRKQKRAKE